MAAQPSVRIVILNYNTRDLLVECLQSLQEDPASSDWHVVVVDNASSDGSAQQVRESFPKVSLVQAERNLGFSAGNNLGTRGAEESYLLFLNSDTRVPVGAVQALVAFLEQTPEAAAVGPRLLSPDGSLQWSCRSFPGPVNTVLEGFWLDRLFPTSRFLGRPRMTWLDHTQTVAVDYVQGAALLVRREAFEAVGGWPEAYFFYAEDADLCYSLKRRCGPVYYHGAVAITHVGGASAAKASEQTTLQAHRSVLLFALRTGGALRLFLQRLATVKVTLPRLLASSLAALFAPGRARGDHLRRQRRLYARVLKIALSRLPSPEQADPPAF